MLYFFVLSVFTVVLHFLLFSRLAKWLCRETLYVQAYIVSFWSIFSSFWTTFKLMLSRKDWCFTWYWWCTCFTKIFVYIHGSTIYPLSVLYDFILLLLQYTIPSSTMQYGFFRIAYTTQYDVLNLTVTLIFSNKNNILQLVKYDAYIRSKILLYIRQNLARIIFIATNQRDRKIQNVVLSSRRYGKTRIA